MNGHLVSTFQEWFDAYVSSFSSSDSQLRANLELKAAHTRRVCKGIARIAASLDLKRMDYDLAFSAALFHDVGRFPQL
jgi:HD superfamily phosphodiesterase